MFEVFGPLARPTPSWAPLVLALLPLVGALAALRDRRRARLVATVVLASCAAAFLLALGWLAQWPAETRLVLAHVGIAARVGELELVLALGLDPFAALGCAAAALVAARLVWAQRSPRRIALLCATASAVELALLADGAATLVLALGLASVLGGVLGYVHLTHFVADRAGEVAVIFGAAVLFWALGGSWVDGQYVPELEPRVVVASAAPAPRPSLVDADDDDERPGPPLRRGARATLSMGSLPGAAVLVDGTWLRDERKRGARAPFADVGIPAGPHTLRVHVGAGSDDYYVPRIDAAENASLALAVRGPTTTFRELRDDLVARDAAGGTPGRAALERRKFFGLISAAGVALAALALAFVARVRAFPFAAPFDDPARALVGLAALAVLARFPVGALAPGATPAIATALAVSSIAAAAVALRTRRASDALAAELAFAGAGLVAGVPAVAAVHAAVASIGRPGRAMQLSLFPARVAVVGACAALPHAAFPTIAALVATLLCACALARATDSRGSRVVAALLTAAGLVLAFDSRAFGGPAPLATKLLDASFSGLARAPAASLPLFALVTALVAFAWGASRTRALDRLAESLAPVARFAPLPARVTSAVARAVAAALVELEARLGALVRLGDSAVRGASALASVAEEVAVVRPTSRLRVPLPSERALRLLLVPLAVVAAALFVVPWAS